MDRKQGIIRLGRSKSPNQSRQRKPLPHQRNDSFSTSRNTWERDPLQESINFNQTFNDSVELKMNKTETFRGAQTFSGFFPQSPEKSLQRVIVKQNIRAPPNIQLTTKSPPNLNHARQTSFQSQNLQMISNPPPIISERETQLQRKIKVLQGRVQELHNQKQASIIHSHEQNKKLCINNQLLESEISNMQAVKNEQIFALREQVQRLKEETKNVKNKALTNEQGQTKKAKDNYEQRIRLLSEQNFNLRESISQMKLAYVNTSVIIEQNNQKIINDYQSRVHQLLEEIDSYSGIEEQCQKVKKQLQFCKKSCEDYVSRLLKKSKQLTNKQMECKQLTESLNQAYNQDNMSKLQEIQENYHLSLQQKNKELITVRNECQNLQKQLERKDFIVKNDESQKLTHLTNQINEKEKDLQEAKRMISQLQEKIEVLSQKPEKTDPVKKEPSKSSMKLKSKTYSRAI